MTAIRGRKQNVALLLKDEVIVVTGAGSGIGAAAVICARGGAKVVLYGLDLAESDTVRGRFDAAGGAAASMIVGVAKEKESVATVDRTVARHGRLDGAFNNVGVGMTDGSGDELTLGDWDRVMDVNARGVFPCVKHETRAMRETGRGATVDDSPIDSRIGNPGWTEYASSKHAVNGITRGAAAEAGKTGIRVDAVPPGYIVTLMSRQLLDDPDPEEVDEVALDRHSVGRFGQPDDVGSAVEWLLPDEAALLDGALLPVDGGHTSR